jgi:hypothetical protein
MAAMFMLQRVLMKEGVQNKTSQAWKLFRGLFLRLCHREIPEDYVGSHYSQWLLDFQPRLPLGKEIILTMHAAARYGPHLF